MAAPLTEKEKLAAQAETLRQYANSGGGRPGLDATGKAITVPVAAPQVVPKPAPQNTQIPVNPRPQIQMPFDQAEYGQKGFNDVMAATRGEMVQAPTVLKQSTVDKAVAAGVPTFDNDIDRSRKLQGLALTQGIQQEQKATDDAQWAAYPGGKEQAIKDGKYKLVGNKQVYDPTPEGKKDVPKPSQVTALPPKVEQKAIEEIKKDAGKGMDFSGLLGALGGIAGLVQAYAYGRTGNQSETVLGRRAKEKQEEKMTEQAYAKNLEEKALQFKNQQQLQQEALKSQADLQANRLWAEKQAQDRLIAGQGAGIPWQQNLGNLGGD